MTFDLDPRYLFDSHPDPMWVFEPGSLRFLAVNDAAVGVFGYSREAFLSMTITGICRDRDVPALVDAVRRIEAGFNEAGIWRLRRRTDDYIHVDVRGHTVEFGGARAVLASVRDVSRLIDIEREHADLLERERESRKDAEVAAHRAQAFFNAAPGKFLVLKPDDFEIVAVSDAYLQSTMTQRQALIGRRLFDVFTGDPAEPDADGIANLRESLEQVKLTGAPDVMAVQRFPIARPEQHAGGFEKRFWSPVNTPVIGQDGSIAYIIHRIEDVTPLVHGASSMASIEGTAAAVGDQATLLAMDVLLQSQELKSANSRLQEQDANLRTAQRLLGLGIWKLSLETQALTWSDNLYAMYGTTREGFGHSYESYVALVHPEDRAAMAAGYERFIASDDSTFSFEHRVVRGDGAVVHVRGVGEITVTAHGRVLTGVVQNVSDQIAAGRQLAEATELVRIAGNAARLGGWRVSLKSQRVTWSAQTAAIHEVDEDTPPSLAQAIEYYAPEHRERIRKVFDVCASEGRAFDEVLQVITAKGKRIWVRAIGEPIREGSGEIIGVQGAFQDISELVQARQRTEQLSHQLLETLENISDAFFTLNSQWRFTFLNSQAEKLLQRERTDLVGKSVWDEFPEAVGTAFQVEYERAVAEHVTVRFTEFYPPLDTWFEVSAYPTLDGLAVYFRDITQERSRIEQLRLLETAVSRQNDMVMITDLGEPDVPGGPKIVFVNDAFVRVTGYSRDEVQGRTLQFLRGENTQAEEIQRIREALESLQPVRSELVNYTRSGEEVWLDFDITPVATTDHRITHWVAVGRNITERKRNEDALRVSEERFRMVTRATNDVIWDWDIEADRLWWNENLSTLFGYPQADFEADFAWWTTRLDPDDRERVVATIEAVIYGGESRWTAEYRFLHADGRSLTVIDRGFVIRNDEGRAVRMLGSMLDVSEQRALDERLRQPQKMEAMGQLTGGVAHDFNNLLTVIMGNAEMLSDQLGEQQALRTMADMTASAAQRGAELTNRLLAFARRQALDPRPVDVNRLIAALDGLLRRTLGEDIDIEFVRAGGLWLAEVDPGQLEVALLNLAINARDSMLDGGCLSIETGNTVLDDAYANVNEEVVPGRYVMVSVSDTGTGMAPDVVEKAFEPFFTTKDVGKGSGLGLSMVFGFVKQSRGHVKIYSELGEGTTVRLYLPRTAATEAASESEAVESSVPGGSEHILAVEDDDMVRDHVVALLKGLGYTVTGAASGPQAIDVLGQTTDIELLFTDVVMPGGMNGRQLADAALRLRPNLSVLFTSGYTENAIVHQGRLDPGVQLISKPYRRQELASKIRSILDHPNRGRPEAAE